MKCYICGSKKPVDKHHYDCCEGELSPETVPLCRRCHRTYHDLGVDWFDDEHLDKAIEVENKRRELHGRRQMTRAEITRSNYFNKTHGIKEQRQPSLPHTKMTLPGITPLCGQDWINSHLEKYPGGVLPRQTIEVLFDGKQIFKLRTGTRRSL